MSILEMIDGALADYEASDDAMRWVPEEKRPDVPAAPDLDPLLQAFSRAVTQAGEDIQRMFETIQPIVNAQFKALTATGHGIHRSLYPYQHQRCVTCHPWRAPKPLAIDGREYQRRLKARRRRRR